MASQFGFTSEMMLFADANRRMLSHALMPVAEVISKLQEIDTAMKTLGNQGITIEGKTIKQPTIPTLPAALQDDEEDFDKIYQQVVVKKNAFPISLISKHDEWDSKKSQYIKYVNDKKTAQQQLERFKAAKFYMNQTVKQDQLLKYYEDRMTTFPFEIEYAGPLLNIYEAISLDSSDHCAGEKVSLGGFKDKTSEQIQTAYRAKIKDNIGAIITAFGKIITTNGQPATPTNADDAQNILPANESDLIKFLLENNVYKVAKALNGETDSSKIETQVNTLTYELDIQPLMVLMHSVVRMSLGITKLVNQATQDNNFSAQALKPRMTTLKKAIVQYKAATDPDAIKTGRQGLINAYHAVLSSVDLNIVTVEKKPDSSKMYIKNPVEIKGKTVMTQFGIDPKSTAGSLLDVNVTIEQLEFDFDDKSMAVEVVTKPQDGFILNKAPDIFYLNYVKVKYLKDGTTGS